MAEDWDAIAGWLAARGHRLAGPGERLAGGLANLNYRVVVDGRDAVLRRPPGGVLAAGASDMGREARVLRALAPVLPLVPRLLVFCDDAGVIGVPWQLIEWRPGVAVGGSLPPGFAATDGGWMTDALLEAMVGLHALAPEAVGLGALGRPGFKARTLAGWARRAEAAFGDARPAGLDGLLARLAAEVPDDAPPRLLHMDLKFDNLLLDPGARCATALIDWDMGTLGPPGFDLAVLLSYWAMPGDPVDVHALGAVPSLTPGWPTRAAVIAGYAARAGGVPDHLGWLLALARLRLGVAWMQLYRLWQRGDLAGDRYAGFERQAGAVIAHAADVYGETA
ncbi:phosphotransferase family protein [Sandaracinobacteroides saxicola]|uniref:Phosphotransferase family protein n=1 Tax=Sandaracinobacteroides saxicola TaxID=2759707 RepID=A0A7G5IGB0_9SPHN|nr:phosphotransferase family protein [Sandaracinobacteroides saxicola]QMW22402.1 phosphotransferase family protein [Sandaracinobacteroides saxicola]